MGSLTLSPSTQETPLQAKRRRNREYMRRQRELHPEKYHSPEFLAYRRDWQRMDRKRNPTKWRKYKVRAKNRDIEKFREQKRRHDEAFRARGREAVAIGNCFIHHSRPRDPKSIRYCRQCMDMHRDIMRRRKILGSGSVLNIFARKSVMPAGGSQMNEFLDNDGQMSGYSVDQRRCTSYFGGRIYAREGQAIEVAKLILKGKMGTYKIAEEVGVNPKTVLRMRKVFAEEIGGPFLCHCGAPKGHQRKGGHPSKGCPNKLASIKTLELAA